MASTQINPTRMELTRKRKKLSTALRGPQAFKGQEGRIDAPVFRSGAGKTEGSVKR